MSVPRAKVHDSSTTALATGKPKQSKAPTQDIAWITVWITVGSTASFGACSASDHSLCAVLGQREPRSNLLSTPAKLAVAAVFTQEVTTTPAWRSYLKYH